MQESHPRDKQTEKIQCSTGSQNRAIRQSKLHTYGVSKWQECRVKISEYLFSISSPEHLYKFKHMFLTQKYQCNEENDCDLAVGSLDVFICHPLYVCVLACLFKLLVHSVHACNIK